MQREIISNRIIELKELLEKKTNQLDGITCSYRRKKRYGVIDQVSRLLELNLRILRVSR